MNCRPLKTLLTVLAALTVAVSAAAQVTFTITATALSNTDELYTIGGTYTFVFTTGSSFTQSDSFDQTWSEEFTTNNQLFQTVSGSALGGTFVRPVTSLHDPFSYINVNPDFDSIRLTAAADDSRTGLTSLNGTQLIRVSGDIVPSSVDFGNFLAGTTSLFTYFASYQGTYALTEDSFFELISTNGETMASFTGTSVTISVAAIPEPSSYAALAGVAALGLVIVRRRRLKPAA